MIRQKAKLPNADEAARQHVLDEASERCLASAATSSNVAALAWNSR